VGGRELQDLIHTRGILTNGDTLPYAFGLVLGEHRGLPTVQHGGSLMGFRTAILRFPTESLSVITLCNVGLINAAGLGTQVAEIFLEDRMDPPEEREPRSPAAQRPAREEGPTLTEAELQDHFGEFFSPELDVTYTLQMEEGDLAVSVRPPDLLTLTPVEKDVFRASGVTFRFERNAAGEVTGFQLDAGRVRNLRFQRVR
jgi:hypothetical protein